MPSPRRLRSIVLAVVLLAVLATGLAQDVTGTISARLGDEVRTWSTIGTATDDGYQATASWTSFMDSFVTISIQGHTEAAFRVEGTLSIDATHFGSFPTDCPCDISEAEVMYWTSSSMFENVYVGEDAVVTLTTVEPLGGDAYRIEGTFSATLTFYPSALGEPAGDDTLAVEGSFVIERLPRESLD